jgi:hypothetical protein
VTDHAEAGRDIFQLLGHVLAQVTQPAAARWAGVGWRRIDFFVARQVVGQRLAYRFLARRLVGFRHLARGLAFVGLQVFQLQFQLLDLMVEFFGLAAELHAPQLGDEQLEVLDLGGARVQLYRQAGELVVAFLDPTLACQQQRLQGIDVVGQVGGVEHAPSLREGRYVYKPEAGFQVRSGRRQSMPSNSIDNCAWLSVTVPLVAWAKRSARAPAAWPASTGHRRSTTAI